MPDGTDKVRNEIKFRTMLLNKYALCTQMQGPHLFLSRIQNRDVKSGKLSPLEGVTVETLPKKIALQALDNAYITFENFIVPKNALLSRFANINDVSGDYQLQLPKGNKRMLDILISRLLTGRVCLSEYTLLYANNLMQESYTYACKRELWISKRQRETVKNNKMSEKPLIAGACLIMTICFRSLTSTMLFPFFSNFQKLQ